MAKIPYTVVHDFNGHEVNGIHGLYGKKGYDKALYSVNKRHDFTEIHDINGKFPYDDIFRKNHARLYFPQNCRAFWVHPSKIILSPRFARTRRD